MSEAIPDHNPHPPAAEPTRLPARCLLRAVTAAVAFVAALGSCDSDPVVEPQPALEIVPDSVTLTHLGQEFAFSVHGGSAVRWRSSDATAFAVDANGSVTARGNGTARVVAEGPTSTDDAVVHVRQVAAALDPFGDGQSAAVGLSLLGPVGVRVVDGGGAPVAGVSVRFEADAGNGSVEPGEAQSDNQGFASVAWTLGPNPGPQSLAVSAEGVAGVAIAATALGLDEAVSSFEVLSGEDQWAWSTRTLAEPVAVRVLDDGERPVSGARVRFEPEAASSTADPETVVSDSAGIASTDWTLGSGSGLQTLAVSTGGDAGVEITATARDPDEAVAAVEVLSGLDQWAVAGRALPDPLAVRVTDEDGQPVWGATVRFDAEAGSGRADPEETATDSLGLASAMWMLGRELGAQQLVVSAARSEVVFDATAVSDQGVCNRTPEVSAEIAMRAGVGDCAEVTKEMLGGIVGLYLYGKGIKRLRSDDFAGLHALETLYLHENGLTELPAGLLADAVRLDNLQLGKNPLAALPPVFFAGLSRLRKLHLSRTRLAELDPDIFAGLHGLEELDLSGNRLTALPHQVFADLDRLEILFVDYNELEELPSDLFAGLSALETLTMSGNRLTSLPERIFDGLSSLESISVAYNQLTQLPPRLFSEKPALVWIQLSANLLAELPPDLFAGTPALERLYLRSNGLQALPPGIFDGLPNLVRLDLDFNDLAELPSDVFAETPKLAQLTLGFNELSELPRGLFVGLTELEWVGLDNNPGAPFPVLPELARIGAGDPLAPGPARVAVRLPLGAPFAFDMPVSVQRGEASDRFVSFLPGDTVSAPFTVSGSGSGAAHVGFGSPPAVTASGYAGLEVVQGEELVLFAASDNASPVARSRIRAHRLQAGGPSADLVLGDYFDDPDGDSLTFTARTTPSGALSARVEAGVLWLDPASVDTTDVEVTATDPGGLRATHRFTAWTVPPPDPDAFNIELYFEPGFTAEEEEAIRRAADRWMEVVTGDLPDVPVEGIQRRLRDKGLPRFVGVIDDLLIEMDLSTVAGNFAATAGVSGRREGSGHAFFGGASYRLLYVRNRSLDELYRLALHEIGHILGIGGWFGTDLLQDRDTDPHFVGPLAVAAFDAAGGEAYSGGKVPLEDVRPVVGAHWRTRVIPDDIMSIGSGGRLLTAITLQALADLGHEVDLSKADPYTLPMAAQGDAGGGGADAEDASSEVLADDVIESPVVMVDEDGKVVRIIRP